MNIEDVCGAVQLYSVIILNVFSVIYSILINCLLLVCGGILNNPAGGNFTSPGYMVSNYSNNLNCEWLIQNPQHVNSSIVVLIEDMHLENHQTCQSDYLQFRLGENHTDHIGQQSFE